jgi:hypothetical protein
MDRALEAFGGSEGGCVEVPAETKIDYDSLESSEGCLHGVVGCRARSKRGARSPSPRTCQVLVPHPPKLYNNNTK